MVEPRLRNAGERGLVEPVEVRSADLGAECCARGNDCNRMPVRGAFELGFRIGRHLGLRQEV